MGLISATWFLRNWFFGCDLNHMYCDLVGPLLWFVLRSYYLGCGPHRLYLENSLGFETSPQLYLCIIVGVLFHVLIFYFIVWLLKGSLESHQSSLTIFCITWYQIKGGSCFNFVTRWVTIGTKGWNMEKSLWSWLSNVVISGWSSLFFSWKSESMQNWHYISTLTM